MLIRRALNRAVLPILVALAASADSPVALDQSMNVPIVTHEAFDYRVEWRLFNAGRARLDWYPSPAVRNGWETKLHLESTGAISRLFHVDDDYTAQMNASLCATSTFMSAREGSRERETKVTYDGPGKKADYLEKDLKTSAVVRKEIEIPGCVHDIIGGLYYLRTMNLEPGKTTQIPISNGKKSVYLKVESQRREDIKCPTGTCKTVRYEIFAFDNQLYPRSGHLHVWLSDDKRRIPIQIEIRLQFTIGTITLKLMKETRA